MSMLKVVLMLLMAKWMSAVAGDEDVVDPSTKVTFREWNCVCLSEAIASATWLAKTLRNSAAGMMQAMVPATHTNGRHNDGQQGLRLTVHILSSKKQHRKCRSSTNCNNQNN